MEDYRLKTEPHAVILLNCNGKRTSKDGTIETEWQEERVIFLSQKADLDYIIGKVGAEKAILLDVKNTQGKGEEIEILGRNLRAFLVQRKAADTTAPAKPAKPVKPVLEDPTL